MGHENRRFWGAGFGNNHLNEPRTGQEIDLLSHEKHQALRFSIIQEAVGLLSDTLQLLRGNENYIRSEVANLSKILNSPQGNVASKTTASIKTLNELEKPPASLRIIPNYALNLNYARNLSSYMTRGVKNIYSAVHYKDKLSTVLDYPRNFGNVANEGLMMSTS